MVLSVLLAAILDFNINRVDQVFEHEILQNKRVILNTKVKFAPIHDV